MRRQVLRISRWTRHSASFAACQVRKKIGTKALGPTKESPRDRRAACSVRLALSCSPRRAPGSLGRKEVVFIGRAPIDNATNVATFFAKDTMYEKHQDTTRLKSALYGSTMLFDPYHGPCSDS